MASNHRSQDPFLPLYLLEERGRDDDGISVASSRSSPKVVARHSRLVDIELFAGTGFSQAQAYCTTPPSRADSS